MNLNDQESYNCIECGERVKKYNQFIHDIKCQTIKIQKNKFLCEFCFKWINLPEKEDHLQCHEIEQREIAEIINRERNCKKNKGLNNETIEKFPVSKIKNIHELSENNKKCLICLDEFINNQDSIILPCIHIFHSNCIKKWMKRENFCPLCKNKII